MTLLEDLFHALEHSIEKEEEHCPLAYQVSAAHLAALERADVLEQMARIERDEYAPESAAQASRALLKAWIAGYAP